MVTSDQRLIRIDELRQHADRVPLPGGATLTLRFAEPGDADRLQFYFRALSPGSRYNRLMGAAAELPITQLVKFVDAGQGGSYSVLATLPIAGGETVVGEARYGFDPDAASFELGLSVDDRWQRHGIGAALLSNLECRAAARGALLMFGDTLRSNAAMIALARKSGFGFAPTPNDWKQMRFEKQIAMAPHQIPCASWRLAAAARTRQHGVSA